MADPQQVEPDRREVHAIKRVISNAYQAQYEVQEIYKFIDSHFFCHVGFQDDSHGFPMVVPMLVGRKEDFLYLHGYVSGRLIKSLRKGAPVCVTITQLDGIVCALSLFHSSVNYRSAVVFGHSSVVEEPEEKMEGLKAIVDAIFPGRWDDARQPNKIELRSTGVIKVQIKKCSMKSRDGPPGDEDEDVADENLVSNCWAGVLPVFSGYGPGQPQQATYSKANGLPEYLSNLIQERIGQGPLQSP